MALTLKDALDKANESGEALRAKRVEAMAKLTKVKPTSVWVVVGCDTEGMAWAYGAYTNEDDAWEVYAHLIETESTAVSIDVQFVPINADDYGVLNVG